MEYTLPRFKQFLLKQFVKAFGIGQLVDSRNRHCHLFFNEGHALESARKTLSFKFPVLVVNGTTIELEL